MRFALPLSLCAVVWSACGASAAEVKEAESSGYDADFAIVYSQVLKVVTDRYPKLMDSPRSGVIQTAWHPINISEASGSSSQSQAVPQPGQQTAFGTTRGQARTFFFIRFRVAVVGGNPWRVRVNGEASKWEEGSTPVPLRNADEPPWLRGRIEAMRIEIHRKLRKHAVPIQEIEDKRVRESYVPKKKIAGAFPEAAREAIQAVRAAAAARQYEALRGHLAEQLVWSHGAAPGADEAIAIWQADARALEALVRAVDGACQGSARVQCAPKSDGPVAVFERESERYVLTEFVFGE